MPGLLGGANQTATTPNRHTDVLFDPDEVGVGRPAWSLPRAGHEIARGYPNGAPGSSNVALAPNGWWGLKPVQTDVSQIHERPDAQAAILRARDYNLAPGHVEKPMWRAPNLLGVDTSRVSAQGDYFIAKRIAAGNPFTNINSALATDQAQFPGPPLPSANIPMERVAVTRQPLAENQGLLFRFKAPGTALHVPDTLITFLWGGPVNRNLAEHAVSFFGSGLGLLQQRVDNGWKALMDFRFAPMTAVGGRAHSVMVTPHGGSAMSILSASTERAQHPGASMLAAPRLGGPAANPTANVYTPSPSVTGYPAGRVVTGHGPLRVDTRQDHQTKYQVSQVRYPTSGALYDLPFLIPFSIPAGTPIKAIGKGYIPAGCTVQGRVYDAATGTALAILQEGGWFRSFAALSNTRSYYVAFTFTGDGTQTPYLESFEVSVGGYSVTRTGLKIVSEAKAINISGPDEDPSHESAHIRIQDATAGLSILRARGRVRTQVRQQYDPADPAKRVYLFDGEAAIPDAEKRGTDTHAGVTGGGQQVLFPSEEWRDFDLECVGLWARNLDQLNFYLTNYAEDPSTPIGPDGRHQPYKVTDVIRQVMGNLGWPADMLDIPDSPIRLFPTDEKAARDVILQPLANPFEFVQHLAKDYLGQYILWDRNGGTRGMWRVVASALPPYTNLWNFVFDGPAGRLVTAPESYPANTTFVRHGHYGTKTSAPEANYVAVSATGQTLPNDSGENLFFQWAVNKDSFDFFEGMQTADPNHPDFLGRCVPIVLFDATLAMAGQDAVDWVCRRTYDVVAHRRFWLRFLAPLVIATDPTYGHRRPLRFNDPVLIEGHQCLIRNCNPTIEADEGGSDFSWAWYEALLLDLDWNP